MNTRIYTLEQPNPEELLSRMEIGTRDPEQRVHVQAFLLTFDRILKAGRNGNVLGGFLTTCHFPELHLSKMQAWDTHLHLTLAHYICSEFALQI